MPPERVRVKEEPGLEREHDSSSACARAAEEAGGQTEGGASEECARAKEEPEWTQDRDSSEACPRAEEGDGECGVSAAAARVGLYAGHEVKGELVLGPERLQPPDSAFAVRVAPNNAEMTAQLVSPSMEAYTRSHVEGPCPGASCGAQLRLWPCSVRLERHAAAEEPCASSTILRTEFKSQQTETKGPPKACAVSEPYSCDTAEEAGGQTEGGASEECARVKEEPGLEREHDSSSACARATEEADGQTEGGASEECARAKEEPQWTQDRDSSEACPRAEEGDGECGVSAAAARAGLYAGHEVKGELVLGPERLQPPDSAFAVRVAPNNAEITAQQASTSKEECPQRLTEGPRPRASRGAQLRLRPCSVRLERLAAAEEPRASSTILRTGFKSQQIKTKGPSKACAVSERYSCDTCGEQFARKLSLTLHIQVHSSGRNHMQIPMGDNPNVHINRRSSRTSCSRSKLGTTQSRKSGDNVKKKVFNCKFCTKQFSQHDHLVKHERIHMGEKPYKCDICIKCYSHLNSLVEHKRIHTGEQPYKCDICMKGFSYSSAWSRHKQTHMGEKPFECDICMKKFLRLADLVVHKQIHTGGKTFECDICMKKFAYLSAWTNHKQTHTGEKPHKCDICMKMFSRSSVLVVHKRIHTGEKPFKCDICVKKFLRLGDLVVHKQIHTEEKPFKCDICVKMFSRLSGLVVHKRIHTGEKPFKCDVCVKTFSRLSGLFLHKQIHTGEKKK